MQIFTSQGVYDTRVVNKRKQRQNENAWAHHTSRGGNSELTFIMLQLGPIIVIFCMTKKWSHYFQEGWG